MMIPSKCRSKIFFYFSISIFLLLGIGCSSDSNSTNNSTPSDQSSTEVLSDQSTEDETTDQSSTDNGTQTETTEVESSDARPKVSIGGIETSDTEFITILYGNTSDDHLVDYLGIKVENFETNTYWDGVEFQSNAVENRIDISSIDTYWEYTFNPTIDTHYLISVVAYDSIGQASEVTQASPIIDILGVDGNELVIERNPVFIETKRITTESVTFTPDANTGVSLPPNEKLVRDSTTDLWERNRTLKIAFRFHDSGINPTGKVVSSRPRFNQSGIFRDGLTPICNQSDADNACFNRVKGNVISWANRWAAQGAINFSIGEWAESEIRISFDDSCNVDGVGYVNCGSWSTLGKNHTLKRIASSDDPTMNIDQFIESTVVHEFGHALGFAHEQLSPNFNLDWNYPVALSHYMRANTWTEEKVRSAVFDQANYLTDPYLETVGDYDPLSIMQYPVAMFALGSEKSEQDRLVSNWRQACTTPNSSEWCISPNNRLSNADRKGMQTLYPRDSDLDARVASGDATWVQYSSSLTPKATAVLYEKVPDDIQQYARNGQGLISIRVRFSDYDFVTYGCTSIPFVGDVRCKHRAIRDKYVVFFTFTPRNGDAFEVARRNFSVEGRRDLGRGPHSLGAKLCSTRACLSAAVLGL